MLKYSYKLKEKGFTKMTNTAMEINGITIDRMMEIVGRKDILVHKGDNPEELNSVFDAVMSILKTVKAVSQNPMMMVGTLQ